MTAEVLPRKQVMPLARMAPTVRRGYDSDFLSIALPLPTLSRGGELVSPPIPYRQFTFVMRRRRRLPLFAAVNIDGRRPEQGGSERHAWILAPRVLIDTWLGLEEYVINRPVTADRKVSVVSGPVLDDGDPGSLEVVLPLQYWKLVTMVRQNGTLCATGYLLRQKSSHAEYATYQVPVRSIGEATGLDLSAYISADPLERPGIAGRPQELGRLDEIRL
ncbi:MAG: hypothetical protein JWR32_4822 [Mycobacterium sp.]|jgi:DNA/RNA endonuclease G (NUC1)|nr:hypothetical protein [Mycobacterium sp.]